MPMVQITLGEQLPIAYGLSFAKLFGLFVPKERRTSDESTPMGLPRYYSGYPANVPAR